MKRRAAEVADGGELQLPHEEVREAAEIMLARSGDRSGGAAEAQRQGAEDAASREVVLGGVLDGGEPDRLGQPGGLPRFTRVWFRERLRHNAQDTRVGSWDLWRTRLGSAQRRILARNCLRTVHRFLHRRTRVGAGAEPRAVGASSASRRTMLDGAGEMNAGSLPSR